MPNPLDIYVSKGKPKLVVKLPAAPKLRDAIKRGGLANGAETYDTAIEQWRQGVEKALERITGQPDVSNQVTNVTNVIQGGGGTVTPPASVGDFATHSELNAAIAEEVLERTAADAVLQAEIDAIQVRYASIAKFGGF